MKKKKYDESEGVWRTIGGRRVFIRKGQSLSEAMKDSGKFKKTSDVSRNEYQDRKAELKRDNLREKWHEADLKAHKEDLKFMKDKINYEGNRLELGEKAHNLKEDYEFAKDIVKDRIDSEEYKGNLSNLKGKHIEKERTTKQVNDEYNELSKKMQQDDYYYKPEDDRRLKKLREEYDTLVARGQEDVNLTEYIKKEGLYLNPDDYDESPDFINKINEHNEKALSKREYEYDLYKRAKENPDSIDPMTENSTDWEALDKKYSQRYLEDGLKKYIKDNFGEESEIYQRNYNKDGSTKTIEETREYLNSKKEKTKKTPYNSKAYAKSLSKSYNAEEEYEDKITPKYIQDIDSARYGNMSDEEAIKTWIDGGADIIYNDDAEKQLKEWGIPVRNDDAYGTYKSELAKQLLPIYRSDKYKTSLMKKPLGDLRDMAEDYNINIKGLSRNEIIEKLLAIYNKNK